MPIYHVYSIEIGVGGGGSDAYDITYNRLHFEACVIWNAVYKFSIAIMNMKFRQIII